MLKYAILILALGALGYVRVRTQTRLRGQTAQLPADARRCMKIVFPAVMGLILVVIFIAIYLLRPQA